MFSVNSRGRFVFSFLSCYFDFDFLEMSSVVYGSFPGTREGGLRRGVLSFYQFEKKTNVRETFVGWLLGCSALVTTHYLVYVCFPLFNLCWGTFPKGGESWDEEEDFDGGAAHVEKEKRVKNSGGRDWKLFFKREARK